MAETADDTDGRGRPRSLSPAGDTTLALVPSPPDPRTTIVETVEALRDFVQACTQSHSVACDVEAFCTPGRALGRVSLLQFATDTGGIYLVDVLCFSKDELRDGLSPLLESESPAKLMYDCRVDAHALHSQFGIRLRGILDLQLLIAYARKEADHPQHPRMNLQDALRHYLGESDPDVPAVKALMKSGTPVWDERPLPPSLVAYASGDVRSLHRLRTAVTPMAAPEHCAAAARLAERFVEHYVTAAAADLESPKFDPVARVRPAWLQAALRSPKPHPPSKPGPKTMPKSTSKPTLKTKPAPSEDNSDGPGSPTCNIVDTVEGLTTACTVMRGVQTLAVDLEACVVPGGRNLGPLSLIQICLSQGTAYLIDLLRLRAPDVLKLLGPILASTHIVKLMFDCRSDSQALHQQLGIRLRNVVDLQLYVAFESDDKGRRRDVRRPKLSHVLAEYLGVTGDGGGDAIVQRMRAKEPVWDQRPLPDALVAYAVADVRDLHSLYKELRRRRPELRQPTVRLTDHFLEMYAPEGDVDEDRSDPEDDTRTISRTAMKRSLQTKT